MDNELKSFIAEELSKLYDKLDVRLVRVERVIRQSVEDTQDSQVEEVARHNLHEEKIRSLESTIFRLDKMVMQLKSRLDNLENK